MGASKDTGACIQLNFCLLLDGNGFILCRNRPDMDVLLGKGDFNTFLNKPFVDSCIERVQNPAAQYRFFDPA